MRAQSAVHVGTKIDREQNRAALGRAGGGWWRGCSACECSGMRRRAGWYLHHAYICALRLHCVCSVSFNGRHLTDIECHDQ